jgi:hypothetical protein
MTGAGGVPPYVYLWQFGDGTGSATQDPGHNFSAGGNYSAIAELVDSSGRHVSFPLSLTLVAGTNTSGPTASTSNSGITTEGWELALSVGVLGALIGATVTIVLRRPAPRTRTGTP